MSTIHQDNYMAGLLDGEGCIAIGRRKTLDGNRLNSVYAVLTVTNTSLKIIHWVVTVYGGRTDIKTRESPRHKDRYTVRWNYATMEPVIRSVYPYLVGKQRQAELVLEFLSVRNADKRLNRIRTTIEEQERLFILPDECQELNRKGLKCPLEMV